MLCRRFSRTIASTWFSTVRQTTEGAPPNRRKSSRRTSRFPCNYWQYGKKHGIRAFINSDTILDKQVNHYSLSKRQFVDWLEHFRTDVTCVNVALEHFYGPGDDPSKFVMWVIRQLLAGTPRIDLTPGDPPARLVGSVRVGRTRRHQPAAGVCAGRASRSGWALDGGGHGRGRQERGPDHAPKVTTLGSVGNTNYGAPGLPKHRARIDTDLFRH